VISVVEPLGGELVFTGTIFMRSVSPAS